MKSISHCHFHVVINISIAVMGDMKNNKKKQNVSIIFRVNANLVRYKCVLNVSYEVCKTLESSFSLLYIIVE